MTALFVRLGSWVHFLRSLSDGPTLVDIHHQALGKGDKHVVHISNSHLLRLGQRCVAVVEVDLAVVGHEADLHIAGGLSCELVHRKRPQDLLHVLADQLDDALLHHWVGDVDGKENSGGARGTLSPCSSPWWRPYRRCLDRAPAVHTCPSSSLCDQGAGSTPEAPQCWPCRSCTE